jgi:hypothetical protein
MNTLTLTVLSSLRGSRPVCPNSLSFRGYPRLTAPNHRKSPANPLNRAKNFSGGSRVSIRGCATNCPNLRLLVLTCAKKEIAGIARSCRKKIFYFFPEPAANMSVTPTNGKSRLLTPFKKNSPKPLRGRLFGHIGKSSRIKLNKGKYNQLKPPGFSADPLCVPLRPLCSKNFSLILNASQTCSELFRPIQSCSDLIFSFRSAPVTPVSRPASHQASRFRSETLTVVRAGPAPRVPGEPNLNAAPPMETYGHLWTVILTKCHFSKNPEPGTPNSEPDSPPHVHHSLTLTPWSQTKANVANCRRSKIRPKTYTLNLNTRNAGLQTGKPIRPPSRPRFVLHACLRLFGGPSLELGAYLELGTWSLELSIQPLPYSALFSPVQHYSALKFKFIFFSAVSVLSVPPC